MRWFAAIAILFLAACMGDVTAAGLNSPPSTYILEAVDRNTLPAPTGYSTASRWVVSGSLTLQPDGYFVLSERDSMWNGHAYARAEWTEGGLWMADASVVTLSDTSSDVTDAYGAGTATYVGSIAADDLLLTIWTDDGTEVHTYRYKR
jgi:hypothetical protein